MLVPYLKTWVFARASGEFLTPNASCLRLDPVPSRIVRRVTEGGWDIDDLARDFGSAWKNDPQRVRALVLNFLGRLSCAGIADVTLPDRVDAIIIDRGWGGVFQHAVDLWHSLNRNHRVLLIAPCDPPYGFDESLAPLLVTPGRLGIEDTDLISTLSIARTILKKLPYGLLLFTHRIMTPYFFDMIREKPAIIYGDSHAESCLRIGACVAPDAPQDNLADILQQLYFEPPESWLSLIHAKALYWAFRHAAENWFWYGTQYEGVKRDFPEFAERLHVVLPPVDTEYFTEADAAPSDNWILFTTTSERSKVATKGLTPLLRVLHRFPAARLRLVLHDLTCIPDDISVLGARVEVLTSVPKAQMLSIYRDSLVNCRISEADSTPVSVLESMACGVPVIVSPLIAQNAPIIVDGQSGFVVEPDDIDSLEQKLRVLFDDPERRKRMGGEARRAILRHSLLNNLDRITSYFRQDLPEADGG